MKHIVLVIRKVYGRTVVLFVMYDEIYHIFLYTLQRLFDLGNDQTLYPNPKHRLLTYNLALFETQQNNSG